MSHEELDNATELDRGNEIELADGYARLVELLPGLAVVGGCCGTDLHHLDHISSVLADATNTGDRLAAATTTDRILR